MLVASDARLQRVCNHAYFFFDKWTHPIGLTGNYIYIASQYLVGVPALSMLVYIYIVDCPIKPTSGQLTVECIASV